jgi:hypothetical protein
MWQLGLVGEEGRAAGHAFRRSGACAHATRICGDADGRQSKGRLPPDAHEPEILRQSGSAARQLEVKD